MMHIDNGGWLGPSSDITRSASPNHDSRKVGCRPELLVIHNISLPPGEFGTGNPSALFLNQLDFNAHPWFEQIRGLRVSAHFLIDRQGHITQFVSCNERAWHAGVSCFQGRTACNDFSIGIELEGTDTTPYTDVQYERIGALARLLRERYDLSAVLGHCHIAPDRKTDPGPSFDWDRFGQMANWPARSRPPMLTA